MTKDEYFIELAKMYINQDKKLYGIEGSNKLVFDVTNINGKDLRSIVNELNDKLKEVGLISDVFITGVGEGEMEFTQKGMREIEKFEIASCWKKSCDR